MTDILKGTLSGTTGAQVRRGGLLRPGSAVFTSYSPTVWQIESQPADAPQWLRQMIDDLNNLARLPEDWDSYGSAALREKPALAALQLLGAIEFDGPAPHVAPVGDGDLHLEWNRPQFGIEIDISGGGEVSVLVDEGGTIYEWDTGLIGDPQLLRALERLAHA